MERDWEQLALDLICVIDCDLYEECGWNVKNEGSDDLVNEVANWLESKFGS